MKWQVDSSNKMYGYFTIRHFDGSPNGNTQEQPIATVFTEQDAIEIVDLHNKALVLESDRLNEREKSCTE